LKRPSRRLPSDGPEGIRYGCCDDPVAYDMVLSSAASHPMTCLYTSPPRLRTQFTLNRSPAIAASDGRTLRRLMTFPRERFGHSWRTLSTDEARATTSGDTKRGMVSRGVASVPDPSVS
jgi:hypothetical protein